jgi:cytochrome c-type biogenesis protein CcmH/NrfG
LALWRLKQYKEAVSAFEEVLRLNPKYTEAQDNIKRLQQQMRETQATSIV